jgi:putative phosphoesterase
MKIGLISDVHANVAALRSVLDDAPSVEEWLHAGDVVGYGPWPRETIALFQEREIVSIRGNHDTAIIGDFHEGFVGLPRQLAEWTADHIGEDEVAYLDALPVELDRYDGRVHVAHGAPGAPNKRIYADDVDASLLGEEDVLVLGHTHDQFLCEFDGGTVVNPGGTGQPRGGDPRAPYAVLDLDTGAVDLRRVSYPIEEIREKAREYDFPEPLIDVYETARVTPADFAAHESES